MLIAWVTVQGSTGPLAIIEYMFESCIMLIAEVGALYVISCYNLDLTLKTQVLTTGCTYLVGVDSDNVEQIKYYISPT